MISEFLKIEKISKYRFVEVQCGKARFISNNEVIPKEHISDFSLRHFNDGFYTITKNICDGTTCSIGKPSQKCIDKKVYLRDECAKYEFHKIENDSVILNIEKLVKILKN